MVDRKNPKEIVGIIARNDIIESYERAVFQRQEIQRQSERCRLGDFTGTECLEFKVHENSLVAGKRIKDVKWPGNCLIISIRYDHHGQKLAHGEDVLIPGVTVIALLDGDKTHELRSFFDPPHPGDEEIPV